MKTQRLTILVAIFLLVLAAPSFAADPVFHTLQKGETLYSVSRKYGVPYEALASANGITDPTKLKVGTKLIIPSVHVVAKGETLFGLAKRYGILIGELLAANRLQPGYILKTGDTLVIPASESPEPAATAAAAAPTTTTTAPATTIAPAIPQPAPVTTTVPATVPSPASAGAAAPAIALPPATIAAPTTVTAPPAAAPAPGSASPAGVPMPAPVKTQEKTVDPKLEWPAPGKALYLDGKLEGIMIRVKPGEVAKAVASGTVVSAGPSRGFSQVVFVQSKSGYVYVYGGNESLMVKTGDQVVSGRELGKIGLDARDGSPIAYFFVFRNGQPLDPALAPRD